MLAHTRTLSLSRSLTYTCMEGGGGGVGAREMERDCVCVVREEGSPSHAEQQVGPLIGLPTSAFFFNQRTCNTLGWRQKVDTTCCLDPFFACIPHTYEVPYTNTSYYKAKSETVSFNKLVWCSAVHHVLQGFMSLCHIDTIPRY